MDSINQIQSAEFIYSNFFLDDIDDTRRGMLSRRKKKRKEFHEVTNERIEMNKPTNVNALRQVLCILFYSIPIPNAAAAARSGLMLPSNAKTTNDDNLDVL